MYTVLLVIFMFLALIFGWRAFRYQKSHKKILKQYLKSSFIIEHLTDGIIECDKDFKIEGINKTAQDLLGLTAGDVYKKQIKPENKNDQRLKSIATILFPLKTSEPIKPGEEFKVEEIEISYPLERKLKVFTIPKISGTAGQASGYVKILRDVTKEEIIAHNKTDLVAIVSHQLRTPLSGVKWVLKALLEGDFGQLNKEQVDLIDRGLSANEGMIDLVDDMLDVSKIERSQFSYKFESKNIVALVKEVVGEHREKARSKNITINENYSVPEFYASIDRKRIEIGISNILTNAINYSRENSAVDIKITTTPEAATISVKDSGIGIPDSDKPHVFEKFFRSENAKKKITRGTGLGLFLVKNIVEGHKGKIWFESREGQGTTFFINLPSGSGVKQSQTPTAKVEAPEKLTPKVQATPKPAFIPPKSPPKTDLPLTKTPLTPKPPPVVPKPKIPEVKKLANSQEHEPAPTQPLPRIQKPPTNLPIEKPEVETRPARDIGQSKNNSWFVVPPGNHD